MFNFNDIVNPETIVVIISSFLVFVIFFFGEIITDPVPFADDRKVVRKIEGIVFFLINILSPAAGVFILILFCYDFYKLIVALNNHNVNQFLWDLFLQLVLLIVIIVVFVSFYFIGKSVDRFTYKNKAVTDGKYYYLQRELFIYFTFFLMLLIVALYYWKNYIYIIPASMFLFLHLLGFAVFSSLKNQNIGIADIYFIDSAGEDPIRECRIFKVNDDNVKIKKDNIGMIINKTQILKIVENMDMKKMEEDKKNQSAAYLRYQKERWKLIKTLIKEGYAYLRRTIRGIQKDI